MLNTKKPTLLKTLQEKTRFLENWAYVLTTLAKSVPVMLSLLFIMGPNINIDFTTLLPATLKPWLSCS